MIGGVLGMDKIEIRMMETKPLEQKVATAKKMIEAFKAYDLTLGENKEEEQKQ